MGEKSGKILYVILEKWADWELAYLTTAADYCGAGKFENVIVSTDTRPKRSIGGISCLPDIDLDAAPEDFAALILIGGTAWRSEQAKIVVPIVRRCLEKGRPLGAICDACRFLAGMGALNGVKHTGNTADDLKSVGERYHNGDGFIPKQAVCDGGIITANGTAAIEFAREACLTLGMDKNTVEDWYVFHKRGIFAE